MLLRWARITFSINHAGHICRKEIQLEIMLSKRGQIQKDKYHIFYYIWRTMLKFYISDICNYLHMYTKGKILNKYHIYKSRGEN